MRQPVDDETIEALARVQRAKERLRKQANPKPVSKPPEYTTAEALTYADVGKSAEQKKKFKPVTVVDRRHLSETDVHVGAGKDKRKESKIVALTLVELLYNAKLIDLNTLMAADRFRTLYLEREGPSQGVGSYGDNPGGSNPASKADRAGSAQTWWEVDAKGGFDVTGKRPRQTNRYDFEAAKLAMCGVIDVEGKRVHDQELVKIMVAAIVQTTDIMTQGAIAKLRTRYGGEKQLPPAGATVVTEALKRLTLHLRYGG